MLQYINWRMRIQISETRTLLGTFMAYDKHMNLVCVYVRVCALAYEPGHTHCGYTVVTLLSRCYYAAITLLLHLHGVRQAHNLVCMCVCVCVHKHMNLVIHTAVTLRLRCCYTVAPPSWRTTTTRTCSVCVYECVSVCKHMNLVRCQTVVTLL
jgi:small nuclear ribonucleoprotein (snRNP)-like protein